MMMKTIPIIISAIVIACSGCSKPKSHQITCHDFDTIVSIALERLDLKSPYMGLITIDDTIYDYGQKTLLATTQLFDMTADDNCTVYGLIDSTENVQVAMPEDCNIGNFRALKGWEVRNQKYVNDLQGIYSDQLGRVYFNVSLPMMSPVSDKVYLVVAKRSHSGYGHGFIFKKFNNEWQLLENSQLWVN